MPTGQKTKVTPEGWFPRLGELELAEAGQHSQEQARAVVGLYYSIQKLRIGASNKLHADRTRVDFLPKDKGTKEPAAIPILKAQLERVEGEAERYLKRYAEASQLGRWVMSIPGIGHVLAASLLAEIDFHTCCCRQYIGIHRKDRPKHNCPGLLTAGAIWRFAGQLPPEEQQWGKGEIRPYNKRLKTTCWKIGDQFRRLSVNEKTDEQIEKQLLDEAKKKKIHLNGDLQEKVGSKKAKRAKRLQNQQAEEYLYVRLYQMRKKQEEMKNERGDFAAQAAMHLENAKQRRVPVAKSQREAWEQGKLPKGGLDLRAARYAVRIFLSHYHHVGRSIYFGEETVPVPFVMAHKGHTHYIPPPNWPMAE